MQAATGALLSLIEACPGLTRLCLTAHRQVCAQLLRTADGPPMNQGGPPSPLAATGQHPLSPCHLTARKLVSPCQDPVLHCHYCKTVTSTTQNILHRRVIESWRPLPPCPTWSSLTSWATGNSLIACSPEEEKTFRSCAAFF